jgi:nucleotide-binding universal stress UspA family protein
MNSIFGKIGIAITFSPTGHALLKEAKRLHDLFNSEVYFIHVGEKSKRNENKLQELISNAGFSNSSYELVWGKGDVSKSIIKICKEKCVDLLIAGALEKEKFVKYYFGSVARRLMREVFCSQLIYIAPSEHPGNFKKFCVYVDYSDRSKEAIKIAYQFAILDNAKELILVSPFQAPELASTVKNASSTEEAEKIRTKWEKEELDKMNAIIKELDLKGININIVALFGNEGSETNRFVDAIKADVFIVPSPEKKLKFTDRVFLHNLEVTFKELPCTLMILKV